MVLAVIPNRLRHIKGQTGANIFKILGKAVVFHIEPAQTRIDLDGAIIIISRDLLTVSMHQILNPGIGTVIGLRAHSQARAPCTSVRPSLVNTSRMLLS